MLLGTVNYLIRGGEHHNPAVLKDIISPLLECVFECYLRSATDSKLWEVLRERVTHWVHCKPVIEQWSVCVSSLSPPPPSRFVFESFSLVLWLWCVLCVSSASSNRSLTICCIK